MDDRIQRLRRLDATGDDPDATAALKAELRRVGHDPYAALAEALHTASLAKRAALAARLAELQNIIYESTIRHPGFTQPNQRTYPLGLWAGWLRDLIDEGRPME